MVKLVCHSGEVEANVGDLFRDGTVEWEIVSFKGGHTYSPSSLGETGIVACKIVAGALPSYWQKYVLDDGSVDWCADSVAAKMLDDSDGKRRSARGDLLRQDQ